MTSAEAAEAGAPKSEAGGGKSSRMDFVVPIGILTLVAIGAGGLFGLQVQPRVERGAPHGPGVTTDRSVKDRFPTGATLKALPPIVTNLASPARAWVRLEALLVVTDEKDATAIAASLTDDFIAFLRTVELAQIQGTTGFQLLREDLMDRARIRSGGRVSDVVIQTLIIE